MNTLKIMLLLNFILITPTFAEKVELTCNENTSLEVKASTNGFTRISVKGDKLRDVMGLEETVIVEKDEANGQLFLRNVQHKQVITLITENGLLQDLTLIPGAKGSMNIVLKPDVAAKEDMREQAHPSFADSASDVQGIGSPHLITTQEILIGFIKHLFSGLGVAPEKETTRISPNGFEAISTRVLQANGLIGEVYTITNTRENTTLLLEKDFYQKGDLALALVQKQLSAGESTMLFVVRT